MKKKHKIKFHSDKKKNQTNIEKTTDKNKQSSEFSKTIPSNAILSKTRSKKSRTLKIKIRLQTLTIIIGFITLFVTIYVGIIEPKFKYTCNHEFSINISAASCIKKDGSVTQLIKIRDYFKNLSIKPGYIDKIEIFPLEAGIFPSIEILHISKDKIFWNQEKLIDIIFTLKLSKEDLEILSHSSKKKLLLTSHFFDNKGNTVKQCKDNKDYHIDFNISVSRKDLES